MAEIRWTMQAADDLEKIVNFVSMDSHIYAGLIAIKIIETAERLSVFPGLGHIVQEMNNPEIRELPFWNYRIIYRVKSEIIEILTIFHQARLLDKTQFKQFDIQ